jgi:hypothetical protein
VAADQSTRWRAAFGVTAPALRGGALFALLIALFAPRAGSAQAGSAEDAATPAPAPGDTAVVVLIGETQRSSELGAVLSELLLRQGVQPQFLAQPRFSARALLDVDTADARVWVFVALDGPQRARLFFRGPFGQRFMLRELALRAGLDEVGRELIARVVESATAALRHSHEGLSRAQAEADLARSELPEPEPQPVPASAPTAVPADRDEPALERAQPPQRAWLIGVRALAQSHGADLGVRYGLGLEAGWLALHGGVARLRVRALIEPSLGQAIDDEAVAATVTSWPLRLGLDLGAASGVHGVWLGASAGVDWVRVAPDRARDAALSLTEPDAELMFAARAELRYELALHAWLLSAALPLDVAFARKHYDVIAGGAPTKVATPWRVRPGVALGCALTF